jgi:hypothetical protein
MRPTLLQHGVTLRQVSARAAPRHPQRCREEVPPLRRRERVAVSFLPSGEQFLP